MGQPAIAARPRGCTRYEDDLYGWVQEQLALLRAGKVDEIDAANVAEELNGVGMSEYRELQSALALILAHMLKWDHQPKKRTRSWANTVAAQRAHFADVLHDNPGLKARSDEASIRAYTLARLDASSETGFPPDRFPASCPYGWDDILERTFHYEPTTLRKRRR